MDREVIMPGRLVERDQTRKDNDYARIQTGSARLLALARLAEVYIDHRDRPRSQSLAK